MKTIPQSNVFLIGPMAAGKSSIGRSLAKRLNKKFYDSDLEVEKRTGVNIKWIFDLEGEEGFRQRETAVLADLTRHPNIVLATGGGSVVRPENRKFLTKHGVVIYLKVSVACQLQRLATDNKRPLLNTADRSMILLKLLQERERLYLKLAHFTVETDDRSIASVTQEIIQFLS